MAILDVSASLGVPIWIAVLAIIWMLVWKGLALWKSARLKQPIWFVILLVVNTLGVLEILYLLIFSKLKSTKKR